MRSVPYDVLVDEQLVSSKYERENAASAGGFLLF